MSLAFNLTDAPAKTRCDRRGMTSEEAKAFLLELSEIKPSSWAELVKKDLRYGEALLHYAMYPPYQRAILFEDVFRLMEENYLKRWDAEEEYRNLEND